MSQIHLCEDLYFIKPQYWGRPFWKTIDSIVATYDPSDGQNRESVIAFFTSLKHLLPCDECRQHFTTYWENYPIQNEFDTRLGLFQWVYRLRCEINTRNKKKNPSIQSYLQHLEKLFDISLLKK